MNKYLHLFTITCCLLSCGPKSVETSHPNGKIKEKYSIDKAEKRHGEYLAFNEQGILIEKANFSHGLVTGTREIYRNNGVIEIKEQYDEQGYLHGKHLTYHPDGKSVMIEKTYTNNAIQGTLKVFYPDGKIKEEVTMKDNNENGPFKEYYQNGALHWQGTYRNGDNEFGELIEYDSLGNIIKKMLCDTNAICRTTWKPGILVK
jgi:antitoxin component YwqK of YwqJK toxin-antitoxin module